MAACAAASAPAPAQAGVGDAVSKTLAASPQSVREYWTPARMGQVQPGSLLAPFPSSSPPDTVTGPRTNKRGSLHAAVRRVRRYPQRTHGKVFFTIASGPDAGDYQCSGTVVDAPSRSLVLTAGHCAYAMGYLGGGSGGQYATNWEFVPAYKGGKKPYGEWPATSLATTSGWLNSASLSGGDFRYDVAAATVSKRNGKSLEKIVGAREIGFNSAREQTYQAYGYPAEQPPVEFDGKHLFSCKSAFTGSDSSFGDPAPISIACDMTGGSSGGGWVIDRRSVVSVTSYGYNNDPETLYGPYFGDAIKTFYRQVKDG